jgi:Spy/CpxP family protein refolding chaperone
MRTTTRTLLLVSLVSATAAGAQGNAPAPARRGGAPAAQMLLARTGELGLTDAQVTRLAAIARRQEARRTTLRAAVDSNRRRMTTQPGDTAGLRAFRERMRTTLEREREQNQTDQRDAIAILTPDQQAKAWDMATNRGTRGMRGGRGMRGMHRGPGMGMGRGMRGSEMRERGFRPRGDREDRPRAPRRPNEG